MAKIKILIIDDVEIVCIAMQEELSNAGYQVDFALTSDEALEMAKKVRYDIVYIDLVMPGVDGADLCRNIKKISNDSDVILMSGQPNADKVMDFINAGGREMFLYKPFLEGELLDVTSNVLNSRIGENE